MSKRLYRVILTLLVTLLPIIVKAQTPYAVWCEGNTTLYFTYRSETLTAGDNFSPEAEGAKTQTITNVWSINDFFSTPWTAPSRGARRLGPPSAPACRTRSAWSPRSGC